MFKNIETITFNKLLINCFQNQSYNFFSVRRAENVSHVQKKCLIAAAHDYELC